jgi:hypothetical protein
MAMSREADLFAFGVDADEVERIADQLEEIGQLSQFDDTHGYYADGVGPETAILPPGWRNRSKTYQSPATNGVMAIVPHPQDIAASKLYAGRQKDLEWLLGAKDAAFIDLEHLAKTVLAWDDLSDERRNLMLARIARLDRGG